MLKFTNVTHHNTMQVQRNLVNSLVKGTGELHRSSRLISPDLPTILDIVLCNIKPFH